jgi:hypothetical protein
MIPKQKKYSLMKVEISRYLENKNSFREKAYAERSILG